MADETATTSGEEHVASPPKVSKVKEISGKGKKAAPKLVVYQNATKHALLADGTATTSGEEHVASPPKKCNTSKRHMERAKKAAPKLVVNQNATKHALLTEETATTSDEEHVTSPQKYLKSKKYLVGAKNMLHQNWLLIRLPQNMHYWLMKQPPH